MRRIVSLFLFLVVFVCSFLFVGCNEEKATVDPTTVGITVLKDGDGQPEQVVISLDKDTDYGDAMLLDVMEACEEKEGFSYTLSAGMITALCDRSNGVSSCWMLYTSDEEFSNVEWGTVAYEGLTLGSAILGAEALPVAAGETYILVYQSF